MNPLVSLTIHGQPITYKAKGQGQLRSELKSEARKQYDGKQLGGALTMDIVFYIEPPRELVSDVTQGKIIYPLKQHGQIDSMTHLVLKYLRHVVFSDPSQVVDIRTRKIYDMRPRTDIHISKANLC